MDGRDRYKPGRTEERAELWEADSLVLPFGTEVWYRFSMFIDPAIPANAGRLVIGQWKQADAPGGNSPVIAQRFNGRVFSITIEQDNDSPGHNPSDTQCRVFVAVDRNSLRPPGLSEAHALLSPRPGDALAPGDLPSVGHDDLDVSHGPTERVDGVEVPKPCKQDLEVETFGFLPDAFGHWVTMLYHIHLAGPTSLVEIWADGQKIAKASGRIGSRAGTGGSQYFKFGPYRDHETFPTFARLARYARGFRREDVEP